MVNFPTIAAVFESVVDFVRFVRTVLPYLVIGFIAGCVSVLWLVGVSLN